MPRYFFNIQDGQALPDSEGTVCADLDDARAQAVIASGALLKDLGARFRPDADWRMQVTDELGATVCNLRFSGSVGVH